MVFLFTIVNMINVSGIILTLGHTLVYATSHCKSNVPINVFHSKMLSFFNRPKATQVCLDIPAILNISLQNASLNLRDWSLITGRGGGATKWEIVGPKLFAPHSQDRVKLFVPPPPL